MPTSTERNRWRVRLGYATGEGDIDDDGVDFYFTWATDELAADGYTDADLIFKLALVHGCENLLMQARKRVTHKAGESSENLSDIQKGLEKDLAQLQAEFEQALKGKTSAIRLVGMRQSPRKKSIP